MNRRMISSIVESGLEHVKPAPGAGTALVVRAKGAFKAHGQPGGWPSDRRCPDPPWRHGPRVRSRKRVGEAAKQTRSGRWRMSQSQQGVNLWREDDGIEVKIQKTTGGIAHHKVDRQPVPSMASLRRCSQKADGHTFDVNPGIIACRKLFPQCA